MQVYKLILRHTYVFNNVQVACGTDDEFDLSRRSQTQPN